MRTDERVSMLDGVYVIMVALLLVAPIVFVGDRASAGPVSGGKPKPPDDPGNDPGASTGEEGLLTGGDSGGSPEPYIGDPPPPPNAGPLNFSMDYFPPTTPNDNASPPIPDFTVSEMRSSHSTPQQFTQANVSVAVSNVGMAPSVRTKVSLYIGSIEPAHLIGTQTVDMVAREDTAYFPWTTPMAGNYTLIAFVDPSNETAESNEGNNTASLDIPVSTDSSWGLPDVTGHSSFPGLPEEGNPTQIDVTVSNTGYGPAENISVEVWERPTNILVAQYNVSNLAMGAADDRQLNWTPSTNGTLYIEVATDVNETVYEWIEGNNNQTWGIFSSPPDGCTDWFGDYYVPPGEVWEIPFTCKRIWGNVTVDGTLWINYSKVLIVSLFPGHRGFQVNSSGSLHAIHSALGALRQRYSIFFKALAGSSLSLTVGSIVFWTHTADVWEGENPGAGGLQVYTANVRIENVSIREGDGHGAYLAIQVPMNDIRNVTFQGNKAAGAVVMGSSGVFRDNTFSDNDFGLIVKDSTNLAIRNSAMSNNVRAGEKRNGVGLLVKGASPTVEDGTRFLDNVVGAWVNSSSHPVFRDCVFESNLQLGLYVGFPPKLGTVGVEVDNSRINGSITGVSGSDSAVTMSGNSIENFTGYGIYLVNSTAELTHNNMTPIQGLIRDGYPGAIICLGCSLLHLSWNNIYSHGPGGDGDFYYGIYILDSGGAALVANNSVKYGVFLFWIENSAGEVRGNSFIDRVRETAAHGAGILVRSVNYPLRIRWNEFTNVSKGIRLDAESSKVPGTVVIDNNTMVYRIYPPGYRFGIREYYNQTGNLIAVYSEGDQGHILVYSGSSPLIENNTLIGHVYGTSIESGGPSKPSSPNVLFNRVSYPGAYGISDGAYAGYIDSNAPQVIHNWVNHSSGTALHTGSYTTANYSLNRAYQSHGWILSYRVKWRNGSFDWKNMTYSNSTPGSFFVGGNATTTLWNNTIDEGDLAGILVTSEAEPRVLSNTVLNHPDGIAIHPNGRPELVGNNITSNEKGIAIYRRSIWAPYSLNTTNRIRGNYAGIFIHNVTEGASGSYAVTLDGIGNIGNNNYSVYINDSFIPRIHNVTIDNSTTPDLEGVGIYIRYSSPVVDGGTHVLDSDFGIVVMGFYGINLIPHIESTTVRGGEYGVYAGVLGVSSNFEIFDSTIVENAKSSIVANSQHLIVHNTISSPETGIAVTGFWGTIQDNNVSDCTWGIYETGAGAVPEILENEIWNCTYGVYASANAVPRLGVTASSAGDNHIKNPKYHADARYGVYASNIDSFYDAFIVDNTFLHTNNSVYLTGQASEAYVRLNNFTGSFDTIGGNPLGVAVSVINSQGYVNVSNNDFWETNYSIRANGAGNIEIYGNDIFSKARNHMNLPTTGYGIFTVLSAAKILYNNLTYVGETPIYGGAGIKTDDDLVAFNEVSNYYDGVSTYWIGMTPYIRRNTLDSNMVGVKCYGCHAYIENNEISQGSEGIQVWVAGSHPYIANNTMTTGRGQRIGIRVFGGNPQIVNNTIYGGRKGIEVSGGAPWIHGRNRLENNTVTSGGGGYGLYVTSTSQFDITDNNTFKNNAVAGIYLGANTYVTIRDNNTIANNGQYGIWISKDANIFQRQIWWNDIVFNGNATYAYGIYRESGWTQQTFATCNWWHNATGPKDIWDDRPLGDYNPYGSGDWATNGVKYRNWLESGSVSATGCEGGSP